MDVNGDLYSYLRGARETLVWKLERPRGTRRTRVSAKPPSEPEGALECRSRALDIGATYSRPKPPRSDPYRRSCP